MLRFELVPCKGQILSLAPERVVSIAPAFASQVGGPEANAVAWGAPTPEATLLHGNDFEALNLVLVVGEVDQVLDVEFPRAVGCFYHLWELWMHNHYWWGWKP